jgi:hypothetical protein
MAKKTRKMRSMKNVTIQFIPHSELAYLTSYKRVKKLLEVVGEEKIVFFQGKLSPEEEADLIEETMKRVGKSKRFKGIELTTFSPKAIKLPFFTKLREGIAGMLVGSREDMTVIGPATIIREIKKDPTKIQLLLKR